MDIIVHISIGSLYGNNRRNAYYRPHLYCLVWRGGGGGGGGVRKEWILSWTFSLFILAEKRNNGYYPYEGMDIIVHISIGHLDGKNRKNGYYRPYIHWLAWRKKRRNGYYRPHLHWLAWGKCNINYKEWILLSIFPLVSFTETIEGMDMIVLISIS